MVIPPARRIILFVVFVSIGLGVLYGVDPYKARQPDPHILYFFYTEECAACAGMRRVLDDVHDEYASRFTFVAHDVGSWMGKSLYAGFMRWHGEDPDRFAVPVVFVNGGMVLGFSGPEKTASALRKMMDSPLPLSHSVPLK